MKQDDETQKLYWACRRGMLELDVLLGNFLREAYPNASAQDQKLFGELLLSSDSDLFAWLLGQQLPPEGFATIVEMIRHHARSRV